jgi:hypothetical protein
VFTSVTGLFTVSVSVAWPLAYVPPAIATLAVVAVNDLSRKGGGFRDNGKSEPGATDSSVPFTERTADVGGGEGGDGGVAGVDEVPPPEPLEPEPLEPEPLEPEPLEPEPLEPEPLEPEPLEPEPLEPEGLEPEPLDPEEAVPDSFGPSESNGSLLAKRENDWSWPASAGGCTAETSADESDVVLVPSDDVDAELVPCEPASVGAVRGSVVVGVVLAGVVVATVVGAASGFAPPPLFSPFMVLSAYAIASTRTNASAITIFFCLAAFALAGSATLLFFLAICRSSRAD